MAVLSTVKLGAMAVCANFSGASAYDTSFQSKLSYDMKNQNNMMENLHPQDLNKKFEQENNPQDLNKKFEQENKIMLSVQSWGNEDEDYIRKLLTDFHNAMDVNDPRMYDANVAIGKFENFLTKIAKVNKNEPLDLTPLDLTYVSRNGKRPNNFTFVISQNQVYYDAKQGEFRIWKEDLMKKKVRMMTQNQTASLKLDKTTLSTAAYNELLTAMMNKEKEIKSIDKDLERFKIQEEEENTPDRLRVFKEVASYTKWVQFANKWRSQFVAFARIVKEQGLVKLSKLETLTAEELAAIDKKIPDMENNYCCQKGHNININAKPNIDGIDRLLQREEKEQFWFKGLRTLWNTRIIDSRCFQIPKGENKNLSVCPDINAMAEICDTFKGHVEQIQKQKKKQKKDDIPEIEILEFARRSDVELAFLRKQEDAKVEIFTCSSCNLTQHWWVQQSDKYGYSQFKEKFIWRPRCHNLFFQTLSTKMDQFTVCCRNPLCNEEQTVKTKKDDTKLNDMRAKVRLVAGLTVLVAGGLYLGTAALAGSTVAAVTLVKTLAVCSSSINLMHGLQDRKMVMSTVAVASILETVLTGGVGKSIATVCDRGLHIYSVYKTVEILQDLRSEDSETEKKRAAAYLLLSMQVISSYVAVATHSFQAEGAITENEESKELFLKLYEEAENLERVISPSLEAAQESLEVREKGDFNFKALLEQLKKGALPDENLETLKNVKKVFKKYSQKIKTKIQIEMEEMLNVSGLEQLAKTEWTVESLFDNNNKLSANGEMVLRFLSLIENVDNLKDLLKKLKEAMNELKKMDSSDLLKLVIKNEFLDREQWTMTDLETCKAM